MVWDGDVSPPEAGAFGGTDSCECTAGDVWREVGGVLCEQSSGVGVCAACGGTFCVGWWAAGCKEAAEVFWGQGCDFALGGVAQIDGRHRVAGAPFLADGV